ncbi:putative ribonuclease H-like domain-containing protein [Tanacetum coccineum]
MEVLHTLHIGLCGPMRAQSINGKKYILVIIDDYSRFTWVKFLRSKDETLEFIIKFLKQIQVGLNKTQNGIIERQNQTFVEAARTMLIFKSSDVSVGISFFGALCYPTNDNEDLGKLKATTDIGIFVGYAPNRKGYRIYNKRTRQIMEIIHVQFDELTEQMAHVRISIGPEPILLMPGQISSGLVPNPVLAAPYVPPTNKDLEILFQPMFDEYLEPLSVATGPTIEDNPFAQAKNDPFVNVFAPEPNSEESSSRDVSSAKSTQVIQPHNHLKKWSKDHPLDNVIGNPSRSVSTKKQLATDALWYLYNSVLSKVKPKNVKTSIDEACWFEAMQEEIHEFDRLQV